MTYAYGPTGVIWFGRTHGGQRGLRIRVWSFVAFSGAVPRPSSRSPSATRALAFDAAPDEETLAIARDVPAGTAGADVEEPLRLAHV